MTNLEEKKYYYYRIEGGCVTLLDDCYVERVADTQLYKFAQAETIESRVCFVLAPRQMGKSSLMVRTADKLTRVGQICVQINLHQFGKIESDSVLYFSILEEIIKQIYDSLEINLSNKLSRFWANNLDLAPAIKFRNFMTQEILARLQSKRLIIFIDEIQNLIAWQLQNSFLALIRSLADANGTPALDNLLFVLLGITKPSDLITDGTIAWNLGTFIELDGLDGDCEPLKEGLQKVTEDPTQILKRILYWTKGQPFLTQVICYLVVKSFEASKINTDELTQLVDGLVQNEVIENWQQNRRLSLHLPTVEDWFMNVESSQRRQKRLALEIYINLLQQELVSFNRSSTPQWELLISGLVKKEGNQLNIRNPIYQAIFDRAWAESKLPQLQEDINMPDINTIYNRQVFILIDQSGSMVKHDGKTKTRYERLQENIEGHLDAIIKEKDRKTNDIICSSVVVTTFNKDKKKFYSKTVDNVEQLAELFEEHPPANGGNICPMLEKLINTVWLEGKEKITKEDVKIGRAKAALFIIYVDGQFDDAIDFEALIRATAAKIDDDRIVKFIIIGIGDELSNTRFFDEFDIAHRPSGIKKADGRKEYKPMFHLSTGTKANVGVFEQLKEGLDESSDFIDLLKRQIDGTKLTLNNVREGFTPHLKDFFDEEG